jgi:hypothetical protein
MMLRSVVRFSFGAIFMLSAQLANAQISGQAAPLSPDAIRTFLAAPSQLLNQFPNGGPGLIKQVGDLVDSDKATLATLIAIAKTANEDQRKAIANALAQVAKAYASSGDPAFANQIQQAVASSGLPEFAKAYAEAAGDTGTASTGGGGGGGGGPNVAGAPTGGQNSGSTAATGGTLTTGLLLGSSGVGGGGFSSSTPTIITQTSPQ